MRHQLEGCDRLVTRKNQELQAMGGVLAAANQKIHDRDAEIEKLEQKLAAAPTENSGFDSAGKAGELVSWLRKEVGKALPKQVTVKAIQKILEGGDN